LDIRVASGMLSQLNIKVHMDNYVVDVKHFRVSDMSEDRPVKRHTHSSFEYHIIKSGRCRVKLDNSAFEANAGEFYLTAPGVYHEQIALSSGGYIEYSLNCEIILSENYSSETDNIVDILTQTECKPFKDTQNIIRLFEQSLYEAYHKNIGFYGSIKNLICTIIISSARAMNNNLLTQAEVPSMYKDNDFRLIQIERFIQDNIAINLTTDDISRYMCLSNKQICRIIKEKTGIGTKDLILSLKLEKAKKLLLDTDYSLKNISQLLGFENEIYFNQLFKKKEGLTPGIYRKNIRI
jgi:YesN/AraC family two-component response regulator